ncbi:hypothetical protein ID852_17490 [Xenorhabdus sp. 42]|uniref:Uncharacterized protein n=2 Tax=Xenorhabdus szentirmaii TaxID=290112 RepID=W1IZJ9_9GAMM|nr:hypothetical protein [Xenorhabdus sp. 38]MBD2805901.1 hypothetical protein [Xenorhabdus sp. ZM]MBD2822440.1 hypothetical protein [Xenorhabdus sp. 42]MBD2823940.1 hypothetical protein [Xenorhabdus sp. 5]PHM32073.1 hypothetical protein Xsze_02802 [Xenorhabdus szentirmaii DSM 16338]PHM41634.1 hypothetical protein Xszus_01328 [Xenorhabdus szentirmaii]
MLGLRLSNFIRICIVIFSLIIGIIFFIASLANVNVSYTKRNFIYYYMFTFNEIKNAPLISSDYIIYYDSPDGNNTMTNEITFSNVKSNRLVELIEYTENMGFKKYFDKYWGDERWRKDGTTISIKQNDTDRTILFLVEKN